MNYRLCQTPSMRQRKPPWREAKIVQEMKGFQRDFNKRSQALQKDCRIITESFDSQNSSPKIKEFYFVSS